MAKRSFRSLLGRWRVRDTDIADQTPQERVEALRQATADQAQPDAVVADGAEVDSPIEEPVAGTALPVEGPSVEDASSTEGATSLPDLASREADTGRADGPQIVGASGDGPTLDGGGIESGGTVIDAARLAATGSRTVSDEPGHLTVEESGTATAGGATAEYTAKLEGDEVETTLDMHTSYGDSSGGYVSHLSETTVDGETTTHLSYYGVDFNAGSVEQFTKTDAKGNTGIVTEVVTNEGITTATVWTDSDGNPIGTQIEKRDGDDVLTERRFIDASGNEFVQNAETGAMEPAPAGSSEGDDSGNGTEGDGSTTDGDSEATDDGDEETDSAEEHDAGSEGVEGYSGDDADPMGGDVSGPVTDSELARDAMFEQYQDLVQAGRDGSTIRPAPGDRLVDGDVDTTNTLVDPPDAGPDAAALPEEVALTPGNVDGNVMPGDEDFGAGDQSAGDPSATMDDGLDRFESAGPAGSGDLAGQVLDRYLDDEPLEVVTREAALPDAPTVDAVVAATGGEGITPDEPAVDVLEETVVAADPVVFEDPPIDAVPLEPIDASPTGLPARDLGESDVDPSGRGEFDEGLDFLD